MKITSVTLALFCLLLAAHCYADTVQISNDTGLALSINISYCKNSGPTVLCEKSYPYEMPAHQPPLLFPLPIDRSIFQVLDSIETSKKQNGIEPFMPACRAEPSKGTNAIILENHGGVITCKATKIAINP